MAVDGGYRLACNEGVRGIESMAVSVRDVRDRAGTVVTAAGIAAGLGSTVFLSDEARRSITGLGTAGIVAVVVSFAAMVCLAVVIWMPIPGRFVNDPRLIIRDYLEGPAAVDDLDQIYRDLAIHFGANIEAIESRLQLRQVCFVIMLIGILGLIFGFAAIGVDVAT
jgi:hypothetical protein